MKAFDIWITACGLWIVLIVLVSRFHSGDTTCADPDTTNDGTFSPPSGPYEDEHIVTYTCNTGYDHTSGDLTISCNTDTWNGTTPTCTIVTCTAVTVSSATKSPDQTAYNYNTNVVYICDTGYEHTSGDLTRTCTASATWSDTTPVCSIVTCAEIIMPNAAKSPDQAMYNYNTNVVYICDTGYERTSGDLTRTCTASATWSDSTPVCSIVTCAEIIVPNAAKSPDQVAYNYNTNVVYNCDTGYERTSGDLTRTCTASATWSDSTPVCSIVTCAEIIVPNAAKYPDQPTYNYNTNVVYMCDVGYERTSGDLTRTCTAIDTWSDTSPVCSIKTCSAVTVAFASKSPDQTMYDYNTNVVYICDSGYEHTSGDLTRTCTASATWSDTTPVCSTITCAAIIVTHAAKSPDLATYNYNTNVVYNCDVGYEHTSGDLTRTCTAIDTWNGATPTCTTISCAAIIVPNAAKSPDLATYDYNITVVYSCDVGYEHTSGELTRTCTAIDTWSGLTPMCTIVTCAAASVAFTSQSPDQTMHDYNTVVVYSCDTGYEHTSGNLTRACQANATWTDDAPTCSIVTCAAVNVSFASKSPDQAMYDYNTNVVYTCDTGYERTSGDLTRTCTASATWSESAPVCSIKTCAAVTIANASPSPDQPTHEYNTTVTYICDVGFELTSGDLVRNCTASAAWSGVSPVCTSITCAAISVSFSSKSPDPPTYNYNTNVVYICDTGYEHTSGDLTRTCTAIDTWSDTLPVCSIKNCTDVIVVGSSKNPDIQDHNMNTSVVYACLIGYDYTSGDLERNCTESATWTGTEPVCTIRTCNDVVITHASKSPDTAMYNYNTNVVYMCDVGYELTSGDLTRTCTADTTWSDTAPVCTLVTCTPDVVTHSTKSPEQAEHDYNTVVTYTCDEGYELTAGVLARTCLASGLWSGVTPVCSIKTCVPDSVPFSTKSPTSAAINYTIDVAYTCITGYEHTSGEMTRTCQANKTWTGDTPVCTIKTCPPPEDVINGTKSPDETSYDYNTHVIYTCITGYTIGSGNSDRVCTDAKTWNGTVPTCIIVTCLQPAAVADSTVAPDAALYDWPTSITYTCITGYEITSGSVTRTCEPSGSFNGSTTVCTIKTCNKLTIPNASQNPNTTTYDYDTNVTYECDLSFNHTAGNLTRTCDADAVWTGTLPTCTVAACLPPATIPNLFALVPAPIIYQFGETVTYDCSDGYYISAGNETRTCLTDGTGTGVEPTCSFVRCTTPATVSDSTYTPVHGNNLHDYNTAITWMCNLAYNHTAGNLTRTCQEDFSWTDSAPVCTVVACIQEDAGALLTITPDKTSTLHEFHDIVTYECITGYNHSTGDLVRTCQPDGQWDGQLPTCVIVTCTQPPIRPHTSIFPDISESDYNTDITYTCELGYNRTDGDAMRTCNESSEFNGNEAICTLVTCDPPDPVTFSIFAPDISQYNYSDVVNFTCDFGYHVTSGVLQLTCNENAGWTGVRPVCSIVLCPKFHEAHSTVDPVLDYHEFNTSVESACVLGYNLTDGDAVRTCQHTGVFDGTPPNCTIITCPQPPIPPYTSISPNFALWNYGTDITYTCDLGYNRTSGDEKRTCTETREFAGTAANCTLVICEPPDVVLDSTHDPDLSVYNYSTVVTFTCNYGYYHTTGDLSRTCNEHAQWTDITPVCPIVECPKFSVSQGVVTPDQNFHDFNASVLTTCVVGYNLTVGDAVRTCQNTTQFDGILPSCTIVTCDQPSIPAHTSVTPDTPEYNYNTDMMYVCDLGYNRTGGDETRRCNETGVFYGVEANCTLVTCEPPDVVLDSTHDPDLSVYNYSTVVTFTCNYGYYHTTGDLSRTCNEHAQWTDITPACPIVECPKFSVSQGVVTPDQNFHDFNASVLTTCVVGYNLTVGDAVRTCQNTTQFDGILPSCTIVTCDQPSIPSHTSVTPDTPEYNYNTDMMYVCDLGYNRTGGDETRRCNETGVFNGVEANCTLVTCEPPDVVLDSTHDPDLSVYNYSTVVTFTCNYGYYHTTGDLSRTCNEHAQWTDVTPACPIVQCPKFLEPYSTVDPDQALHDFNTSVETTCILGYNMTGGDAVRTCQNDFTFSGTLPLCTIVECDLPPTVDHSTLSPTQSVYVYLDVITYECDLGYELTSGDLVRTCTETSAWTNVAPNCTIIYCPPPDDGTRNRYYPVQLEYEWQTDVTYTCDIGYNHSTGDQLRSCHHDKTWTGVTPDCVIVTCDKIDVPHMTFDPPTATTHDFNTTIEYACDVGYNHTTGDLQRTCNYTGIWTNELPNCTIITCDPPDSISNTEFTPTPVEHDWNTSIVYTCTDAWHYTVGFDTITCNETGAFFPADYRCDKRHELYVSSSEPAVTWMNMTANETSIMFEYDDLCDVAVTTSSGDLVADIAKTGTGNLTVYVNGTPSTPFDVYSVSLRATRHGRSWPVVTRTIFYGEEILAFIATLENPINILAVDQSYTYTLKMSQGTNVTLNITFDGSDHLVNAYPGIFPLTSIDHTYTSPGIRNITVGAENMVSQLSDFIEVEVIYKINSVSFEVDSNLKTSVDDFYFNIIFGSSVKLPMNEVNLTIDFDNGTIIKQETFITSPQSYNYTVLYGTQGFYNASVIVENVLNSETHYLFISVWDNILNVKLECLNVSACHALVRNETVMEVQFKNVPTAGFEYSIHFEDGSFFQNQNESLLYDLYNLSTFEHVFMTTGIYNIDWRVHNKEYSVNGTISSVTVQNRILDLKAWLNNAISYIEVGVSYQFESNVTQGTSVTLAWDMETSVTLTTPYPGEFSYGDENHAFHSPGDYIVHVTASNLVSSMSADVLVTVIYAINNITFTVDHTLANTTLASEVKFTVLTSALLTMDRVNLTIDYKHGTGVAESYILDQTLPLPKEYTYSHLFDTQGVYIVNGTAENILGSEPFTLTINVWDTLIPLDLIFNNGPGKYITNTTTELVFTNTPHAGFKYSIDYGDGSTPVAVTTDAIMYANYTLGVFSHNYTLAGTYTITWTAENGHSGYKRNEAFTVLIQNRVPNQGYVLEPEGRKYPWKNLQSMDISVNITLNATTAPATDAVCIFIADDGSTQVSGLSYNSSFFEYQHRYLYEGVFNSTLDCSNEVSSHVYSYIIEVEKYNASYLSLDFANLVPLNVSDTVDVMFHVQNGDFYLIPEDVIFDWSFGDGGVSRRRRSPVVYDMTSYTHTYNERGDFVITLIVYADVTNTNNTLTYPIRLGIMHFELSSEVAFINDTIIRYNMYGVVGLATQYTVYYDDGTANGVCVSMDANGCTLDHMCPVWGYKNISVIASNDTFVEVDEIVIVCDNPIPEDMKIELPDTVANPDGFVDLYLRLKITDLYLPMLWCVLSMGDPIKKEPYLVNSTVTYEQPFNFNFQYIALGRHTVDVDCENLINQTSLTKKITVTNENFLFLGVFDRYYSQKYSPMCVSSMRDTEAFNRLIILANYESKTRYNNWTINSQMGGTSLIRHGLLFMRGLVEEKQYELNLIVGFVEEPTNKIFEPTFIKVVMPPPHAELVGGTRRLVNKGSVVVDASTYSYDPVYPDEDNITFWPWSCKTYNASSFDDALTKHTNNNPSGSCTYMYNILAPGKLTIDTTGIWSDTKLYHVVTVTVNNGRGGTSSFTQILKISSLTELSIKCTMNCLSKVAVSSSLQLVPDLTNYCPATFLWKLQKKYGSSYGNYSNLDAMTGTASSSVGRTLTLQEDELTAGSWYLVTLTVNNAQTAYYEFMTNRPPQGGNCRAVPYDDSYYPLPFELSDTTVNISSVASNQTFNLTCNGWMDEGFTENDFTLEQPLFYYFYLQYSDDDSQRQILYFDPGATSNLVTLAPGDPDINYQATIVLHIRDVIGDYVELKYLVESTPSLTTEDIAAKTTAEDQLSALTSFVEGFNDDIHKANVSWDYRTLSRKIMEVTSVYNALLLNTTSEITLTPEDLLSLGFKTKADGDVISWAEYWSIIVENVDTTNADLLIQYSEMYVRMLHNSIMTWPTGQRITIVAIETMSRALNATMAKTEYSNDTAAIMAAELADILARNLAEHVEDRTFPNTAEVLSAAMGVRDLIRGILAELQTVLTPNLPEDPTVDEMREYLKFIRIFKTDEDIYAEPLSLQEQTFLAQKQLQKYYLQKYIKSESSKKSLPFVTNALRNLTYVLSKMSQLGDKERFLENDFIYISTEISPAYELVDTTVKRPRVALELNSLLEDHPAECNSSAVNVRAVIFKHNPYFWGQFADRITSYVPVFDIDGATIDSPTLTFTLENKVTAECIDETPTYFEDDPNKMIYMLFHRQHSTDDILLFVRPNASELVYKLYFNKDEKPVIDKNEYIYSTEMKTDKWTQGDGYKLLIKSEDFSATGKIWIALMPLLENSDDNSLLTRPFCANVTSVNCLTWHQDNKGEYFWDKNACEVSRASTRAQTVCVCTKPDSSIAMTVGTTFYVPPSKIDFLRVVEASSQMGQGPVLGLVIASFVTYVLLVCWAWREDAKDQYKWSYSLLIDNDIADSYFYILRVYTGMRTGSGTTSNIGFVLVGDDNDTGIRLLDDQAHVGFERGSVRTFVMSSRRYLNELICLRIWHDDSGGAEPSWYLNKITVTDMHNDKRYAFECDDWFDFDQGDTRVDRVLNACPYEQLWSLKEMISYTIAENHFWISVVTRPMKSNFTRIQRLSCLLGLMYLTMIITTMILKTSDDIETMALVVIGPFRFSQEGFDSAMIAVGISTIIILIVSFFFRNAESDGDSNEVNSIFRRSYRKINDKVKIDKSYLATDFVPPAEEAVIYNYHFLPHFCVYIGWTILAMAIGLATYLLISFSSSWMLVKSEEWMTSILMGFMVSFAIIEVIKISILLLVFSLFCKRAYEPPEPVLDSDSLFEITKHHSASLTYGPQFSNVLKPPKIPDEDTLIANKIKRIGDHQLLKIFYQLAFFSGLLYIVYTISYESRDVRSYYLKENIVNTYKFNGELKDMDSYTNWLNTIFLENYFSKSYFGAEYDGTDLRLFAEDLANYRVGPARLRQLRVKPEECLGPLGVNMTCHKKFVEEKAETTNYCLNWKPKPCEVTEKSTYFTSAGWEYKSSEEIWGFTTIATYSVYGGGGYFMKLDVNKDVCLKMFSELLAFNWFDKQTRAVILEFTLYNANANLFVYSKFVAEFPESGGVIPFSDIQVFRLYTNIGPNGNFILFLEFAFLLLTIAATVKIGIDLFTDFRAFYGSPWNWLDTVALIMSYTTISIFIYRLAIAQKTLEVFHKDKNAYVGFENLAFYDFCMNTTHGILVFILSIRVSRILGYSGKINEMAAVISTASSDLFGFLIIFGLTYFTYVAFGTLLFGKETEKYRDLFQTYGTLTEAVIGKNRLTNILTSKPGFAEFYYFTFVLFVLMTLATMAAAILNFSISHVKEENKKSAPSNIVEVIFERIGRLKKFFEGKISNDTKKHRRKDSDSELNDILSDLRLFIRGFRTPNPHKPSKTGDKYRLFTPEPDSAESTPTPTFTRK